MTSNNNNNTTHRQNRPMNNDNNQQYTENNNINENHPNIHKRIQTSMHTFFKRKKKFKNSITSKKYKKEKKNEIDTLTT